MKCKLRTPGLVVSPKHQPCLSRSSGNTDGLKIFFFSVFFKFSTISKHHFCMIFTKTKRGVLLGKIQGIKIKLEKQNNAWRKSFRKSKKRKTKSWMKMEKLNLTFIGTQSWWGLYAIYLYTQILSYTMLPQGWSTIPLLTGHTGTLGPHPK